MRNGLEVALSAMVWMARWGSATVGLDDLGGSFRIEMQWDKPLFFLTISVSFR